LGCRPLNGGGEDRCNTNTMAFPLFSFFIIQQRRVQASGRRRRRSVQHERDSIPTLLFLFHSFSKERCRPLDGDGDDRCYTNTTSRQAGAGTLCTPCSENGFEVNEEEKTCDKSRGKMSQECAEL
jgi:hypothetical protein